MGVRAIGHVGGCGRSLGSLIVMIAACLRCVMAGGFNEDRFNRIWRHKIGVEYYNEPKTTPAQPRQITTAFVQRGPTSQTLYNSPDIAFTGPECIPDSSSDLFDIMCVWTGKRPLTIIDMRLVWTQDNGHVADFERWLGLCGARNEEMIGDQMWALVHSCSTFLDMDSMPAKARFQARASWSRKAPPLLTPYVSCMVRGDNATHKLTIVSPPTPLVLCGPRRSGVPWLANTFSADPFWPMARRTASRVASTEARLSTPEESTAGASEDNTLEDWSLRKVLAPLSGVLGVAILLLTVGVCMYSNDDKDGRENRVRESVPAAGPIYSAEHLQQQSASQVASPSSVAHSSVANSSVAHSSVASTKEAASAVSFEPRLESIQSASLSVAKTVASSSAASVRSASVASMQSRRAA